MRFCPYCENILIPNSKRLYCKVCEKDFNFDPKIDNYTIVKTIKHDDKEFAPIIVKDGLKLNKISSKDRKAFEDFFQIESS